MDATLRHQILVYISMVPLSACSVLEHNSCKVDESFANQLVEGCFSGGQCYPMPGFASAAAGSHTEPEARRMCRINLEKFSQETVAGGRDYIFICRLGYTTGVFRLFLSNTPTDHGVCHIARYGYVKKIDDSEIRAFIPLVEHFDGS